MKTSQLWYCTRQRAGPLVKECRALRPRLSPHDSREDHRDKQKIIRVLDQHSAVCHSPADRLELCLALFGFRGTHYTLTFDDPHLPPNFKAVRAAWRAFLGRAVRWRQRPFDWVYCIEGRHGEHRYHIHVVLHDRDFAPAVVQFLWRQGDVDDEPVLRREGGYRRLAEYFTKEAPDGLAIPIGRHPWSCSRSLRARVPPVEKWREESGVIEIPDEVLWARRGDTCNEFGAYYYGSYILSDDRFFNLE